jgi:hypothetical protein
MDVIALLLLVWLLVVLVTKGKHRISGSEATQSQATTPICFVYVMEVTYKDGRHTKRLVKPGIGTQNRIRQHEQRGWRLIYAES